MQDPDEQDAASVVNATEEEEENEIPEVFEVPQMRPIPELPPLPPPPPLMLPTHPNVPAIPGPSRLSGLSPLPQIYEFVMPIEVVERQFLPSRQILRKPEAERTPHCSQPPKQSMPQTRKEETFDVLKRWISTQLECLLCVEIMTPPIVVCSNGHMICNNCKPKLEKCHFCRAIITARRNIFAEEISKLLKVRCTYAREGCQVQEHPDKIEEHEVGCCYQPVECHAGKGAQMLKCGWKGKKNELLGHIAYLHSMTMIHPEQPIQFTSPYLYERDYMKVSLICAHSEYFWLTLKYDVKKNRRFEAVHFIGHAKRAKEFRYRCELLSCDGNTGVTFFSTTGSIFQETDDVFDTTRHFQMDIDIFKKLFVGKDGQVPGYKLTIEKVRHSEG